jgi:ferritin-like metal-binding protein YciE
MAEKLLTASENKLIQYLNEAYGKEKELETALQAHIQMAAGRASYKKRLQDHLKETKAQAKGLERRIKTLGGKAEAVNLPGPDVASEVVSKATAVANKAVSAAKGPVHALRGTGEAEKLLKNAKTELWNEYEEIGNYVAIETLAKTVGDKETEKLAREFRKQEERMASFLQKLLPQLTKAVATEEIPAAERRANGGSRRRTSTSRSSSSRSSATTRSTSSRSSGSTRSSGSRSSGTRSSGSSRSSGTRSSGSSRSSGTTRSSSSRSSGSKSSGTASGSRSTGTKRTTTSRSTGTKRSTASGGSSRRSTSRAKS